MRLNVKYIIHSIALCIFISCFDLLGYSQTTLSYQISPMQKVEGGTFYMADGRNCHEVTVSDFEMALYEEAYPVNWWEAVVLCNSLSRQAGYVPCYSLDGETDERKWGEVPTFERKVSGADLERWFKVKCDFNANGYRLPTEAEWEYAARGGNKSLSFFFSGSSDLEEVAWYEDNSGGVIHESGLKKPNELGLYDMSGNGAEWCWDNFYGYCLLSQINPVGYASEAEVYVNKILRGGAYDSDSSLCVTEKARFDINPLIRYGCIRLCRSLTKDHYNTVVLEQSEENVKLLKPRMIQVPCQNADASLKLEPYEISDTELSLELYALVTGKELYSQHGNLPAEKLSWYEDVALCNKLSILYGYKPCYSLKGKTDPAKWNADVSSWKKIKCDFTADGYRLPTEAEWEYAAMGGDALIKKKFGSSNHVSSCWYSENSGKASHGVMTKDSSHLKLYCLCGNVAEWCWDWYDEGCSKKVLRGGSYNGSEEDCTIYSRAGVEPDIPAEAAGLRLCRSINRNVSKVNPLQFMIQSILSFFERLF